MRPVGGLQLELYPDQNDGDFDKWITPAPEVLLLWRMRGAAPRYHFSRRSSLVFQACTLVATLLLSK